MKLLAIRLDAAGDVLMCTPALRALREGGHRVSLLTSAAGALAGTRVPGLEDVLRWSAPWMKGSTASPAWTISAMADDLRARSFDGAIIFTSYSQSPLPAAMLCQMAGIPLRLAHCRENPYQLLTHWVREPEPDTLLRHEVERQLDLVAELGCRPSASTLELVITDSDRAAARKALRQLETDPEAGFLLLHPGASAPSRRYPAPLWRRAAERMARDCGLPLVLTAGASEQVLLHEIVGDAPHGWHVLSEPLDFGALAALIGMARVLVACNSAPAHLAAATGTPVVDLYALTNPQHAPWQVRHRLLYQPVPCHTCYQSLCPRGDNRCLSEVAPERVVAAVQELLQER